MLFVTDAFGYGGAEKQLAFVAEGMINHGHSIGICNLKQTGVYGGKRQVDDRIQLFVADIKYRNTFQSNYELIKFTFLIAKKFKPDLIVGFKLAGFYASVVGKLLHIPSVISERADPYRTYKNASWMLQIKLWFINHANGAVFQTKQAAAFFSKGLREKGVVIPNPVLVSSDLPSIDYSRLPKTLVYLGRLDNKQKRLDVMLDAFKLFVATYPNYSLKIYGNGPDEDLVKQWISDKGLNSFVTLMGVSKKPLHDLSREGIFVITSDFEGISNSLLEAMAIGMPVVSTDHTPGGARLLINNGVNGLLVPTGNADAFCHALSLYASDNSLAERCGRNAKSVLERFSPSRIYCMWETYLCNLCK